MEVTAIRVEEEYPEHLAGFRLERIVHGIAEYRLPSNGLQVLVYPQRVAPVATFMVTYRVGSRNEGAGLTGATHFLEHLMFKGTERYNKRRSTSIFHVLQRVGAQINATTWFDRTNYYEMLPSEHIGLAVDIEADRMRGAMLDPEDVESERTVILNEFDRGENEPIRRLYHGLWSAAFVAHPYHHPTIGWRSDIENVTAEGLRHFYDRYYWPNNATISIIGDVDLPFVFERLHERFGVIAASPKPIPEVTTAEPEQYGERRVAVRMPGQLGAVCLGYKAPAGLDADADALDVLSMVLSYGKQSPFFRRLTDTGLTTGSYASYPRLRDPGLLTLFAMLAPGKEHGEVEQTLKECLDEVKEKGVTIQEVERARNQLRAQRAYAQDGPFAVASLLNESIAAGDWRLYAEYLERIERVSPEDVQRVARACHDDRCTVGYYIPATT